jgi:predicted phage tail protein
MTRIIGAGGGNKQRKPETDRDNLDSRQFVTVLDLISEGEIQGLKDGETSIFLNNTPLQSADGTQNFKQVTVQTRNGTQNQTYIQLVKNIESEFGVGSVVLKSTPIVRTITDTTVDAVRVTLSIPALQQIQDDGDIRGEKFTFRIEVQYNGGGYSTKIEETIRGRSADLYQRDYRVRVDEGAFPVNVRVTRLSDDGDGTKVINAFSWSSYTEITYAKLRYPNSALIALRVSAQQFSSIPSRSYLIRGIKVQIPSNATVDQNNGRLVYSGIWNGTFGAAQWCSDPAWILWDLLTSTRYGFGDYIQAAQLDKWAFYAASQYASGLVPNGFGKTEPRFSCNVNIQTSEEAYKLINDMCSVFRAMPYWSTGALTISQDRPADTSYLFTLANVSEEGFSYQGSSRKTRPTVAVVSYLDLETRDIAYEVVEDQAAISKYGVTTTQISAFACTSRGQASRIGEWLLYSEQYEGEVVSFTASIDAGIMVRPGQIIEISDPMRAGSRRGGRMLTATTTTVTVDDATELPTSGGTLSVILPNGTVESRSMTSRTGSVLTVSPAFSAAPNAYSVWVYQGGGIQTSTWRVLTVQEQDGATYAISALAYNESKYEYIERGKTLQQRDITNLNELPAPPTDLGYEEVLYDSNGRALSKIILTWRPVSGVNLYRVRWRLDDNNWQEQDSAGPDYEILDNGQGTYEVEVYSINAALLSSTLPATLTLYAQAKSAPPSNVTGINLVPIDAASAILSWNRSIELDVLLGGKVLIRHSIAMAGASWGESQALVAAAAGSQTQKQVPLLEGTYLLRFEDDTGNVSPLDSTVVVDQPTPQPRQLVQTYAEDLETPAFNGNYTDMTYVSGLAEAGGASGIVISSGQPVDSLATDGNWDALVTIDAVGDVLSSGEYEFGSTYAFPGVFDCNLTRRLVTLAYNSSDFWDDKLNLIDTWDLIDGAGGIQVNALTYVRSTQDDPSGTPVWSTWREFSNAIVRGRGFQFKMVATSTDSSQNILIRELGVELELQQRTEQSATLTTSTATYSVVFANPFYEPPSVGITGFNLVTGDYFAIAAVTRLGFEVTFRNSTGSAVSRQFTYTAIGFGRQI